MKIELLDTVYSDTQNPRFFEGYFHPITHKGRSFRVVGRDQGGTKILKRVERKKAPFCRRH